MKGYVLWYRFAHILLLLIIIHVAILSDIKILKLKAHINLNKKNRCEDKKVRMIFLIRNFKNVLSVK